jgi:2-polyprenyl-6-methoxyphenol hydroxylase-like FAD-dependent oxidoreductase
VQAVIGDSDRITGIRGRTKADSTVAEKGRLVVGADGRHSHVARSVQASESNTKPPLQGTDFMYWSGVPMEGFEFYPRGYRAVYAWLRNENLARIGVSWMGKDFVRDERPACRRHVLEGLRQPLGGESHKNTISRAFLISMIFMD